MREEACYDMRLGQVVNSCEGYARRVDFFLYGARSLIFLWWPHTMRLVTAKINESFPGERNIICKHLI